MWRTSSETREIQKERAAWRNEDEISERAIETVTENGKGVLAAEQRRQWHLDTSRRLHLLPGNRPRGRHLCSSAARRRARLLRKCKNESPTLVAVKEVAHQWRRWIRGEFMTGAGVARQQEALEYGDDSGVE